MDTITSEFLRSLLTGYFVNFTAPKLQMVIDTLKSVFQEHPKLENDIKRAKTPEDFEKVSGEIRALAGSGSITVSNSFLQALQDIRFDHQNGKVVLSGCTVSAPLVLTGGAGTGQTKISDSILKSQGAQVECSGGGKIEMSGDAQISLS